MVRILVVGDFQGVLLEKLKRKISKEDFDIVIAVGDYGGLRAWKPFIMDMFRRLRKGKERITAEEFYGKKKVKEFWKKENVQIKKVLSYLNSLGKPVMLVFGNSDDEWYEYLGNRKTQRRRLRSNLKKSHRNYLKKLKNIRVINYGSRTLKGFNFIGFGGFMDIEAFFKKGILKEEDEEKKILERKRRHAIMKRYFFEILKKANKGKRRKLPKIFVFHYPPFGVFDIIRDKKNPMNGVSAGVKFYSEAMKKYKPLIVFCGHMEEYRGMKKLNGIPVVNPGAAEEAKYSIVGIDDVGKVKASFVK